MKTAMRTVPAFYFDEPRGLKKSARLVEKRKALRKLTMDKKARSVMRIRKKLASIKPLWHQAPKGDRKSMRLSCRRGTGVFFPIDLSNPLSNSPAFDDNAMDQGVKLHVSQMNKENDPIVGCDDFPDFELPIKTPDFELPIETPVKQVFGDVKEIPKTPRLAEKKLGQVFYGLSGGKKTISRGELKRALISEGQRPNAFTFIDAFHILDEDKNGLVDFHEFQKACRR
eukprot:CAMPEP_0167756274 /NCGR_PEP_ID=MMETSP0110_2-20121227/9293_1 /TAXON_ID=629695 /ORGANISM="Gymnochlora sp., Strain CCMP2014" /LENGTH=226 /DNA_ID=CAMNT_0007642363 /DNA_START=139 /DNA_END=819 /DNA_ORIENTATION=-